MPSNRLQNSASPYLLQHADNPVDWQEWGEAAFDEAHERDCPILLSIGYAACHWCHVMAHESFEDEATAKVLNRDFVSIKVDREERPDVDQIYMNALHALGEQGGWPLTMFMDAGGRPFWGGTYFPPEPKYGRPSFRDVLGAVWKTWDTDRSRIEHNAGGLTQHLRRISVPPAGTTAFTAEDLNEFADRLLALADTERGGLSGAPKFPNAPITEAHFRAWKRTGDIEHFRAFQTTIRAMVQGGIFDHVGGGLARYSTDARWLVPHFEKMLYDNAHLLQQGSWLAADDGVVRDRLRRTYDWLLREMRTGPVFVASLDADTNGEEGLTYTWTPDEIELVLGDRANRFRAEFSVEGEPHFEGRHIPHRRMSEVLPDDEILADLEALRVVRDERPQPGRDDKVLTDWNMNLAQALITYDPIHELTGGSKDGAKPSEVAMAMFGDIAREPTVMTHSRLGDATVGPPLLSDHVEAALAAIALYACTGRPLNLAHEHLAEIERHYLVGGLPVMTHEAAANLLVRPSAFQDDPNPSPASRLSVLLTQLDAIGELSDRTLKDRLEGALATHLKTSGHGTAGAANALDHALRASTLVLYRAPSEWRKATATKPDPARLVLLAARAEHLPENYAARSLCEGDDPIAILCEGRTCRPPARSLEELEALL